MSNGLPQYDAPPVIETVLSAQFGRLPSFTLAHAGWFWKNYLDESWVSVAEAARLDDVFERFGDERVWTQHAFQLVPIGTDSHRLQILRNDQERMIQVQNSRFIQNWRKREGRYPSYRKLLPEFEGHFARYQAFVKDAGLGEVDLNQWEVIYVNMIPKGELWNSPRDWQKIFPWLAAPSVDRGHRLDSFGNAEWQFVVGSELGRLFVSLNHVKLGPSKDGQEAIKLQLTARGPVQPEKRLDLKSGFDTAHEVIVRSFTSMTSDAAHKHWKRTV
jgi:uncharacterized protein (TIGR04255 family)